MRLSEILHLVWINITGNKFKVMLTSLGIIVGAATIVLVIAIGQGGQKDVADQFKNLNAGTINVESTANQSGMGGFPSGGFPGGGASTGGRASRRSSRGGFSGMMPMFGGGSSGSRMTSTLTSGDVQDLLDYVPNLTAASMLVSGTTSVDGGELDEEMDATIAAVQPSYCDITNLTLLFGSFFTEADDENKNKVAVIGYDLAEDIFGYVTEAYGSPIKIDGKTYDIVGVLSQMGSVSSGISPDSAIYVPYSTGMKHVFGSSVSPKIAALADDVDHVAQCMADIETVLTQNYPNAAFSITDAGTSMEAAAKSANTLSMLLIAVASIVFVVGGIGIMNVLFVSVQERTKEIGILKALGCSRKEILLEFLLEANFISTLGGVVGVGVSFALVPLVRLTGMTVEPSGFGAAMALVFAIVTGTVFGFYPAKKAADLVPIEALSLE